MNLSKHRILLNGKGAKVQPHWDMCSMAVNVLGEIDLLNVEHAAEITDNNHMEVTYVMCIRYYLVTVVSMYVQQAARSEGEKEVLFQVW